MQKVLWRVQVLVTVQERDKVHIGNCSETGIVQTVCLSGASLTKSVFFRFRRIALSCISHSVTTGFGLVMHGKPHFYELNCLWRTA